MKTEKNKHADGEALHDLFREVFALHRVLALRMDAIHETAGLGTPQVKVLDVLKRRGPSTVPEIAEAHDVSRQFVLTVCHALEERRLIEFIDNPRHRRSRLASLTIAGQNAITRFRKAEAEIITHALPCINADFVISSTTLLQQIRELVEEKSLQDLKKFLETSIRS